MKQIEVRQFILLGLNSVVNVFNQQVLNLQVTSGSAKDCSFKKHRACLVQLGVSKLL